MDIRSERPEALTERARWLVPPRLRTIGDEAEERRATWLELFFDLLFWLAYLAAMLAIAAMAVLARDVAQGDASAGFAIAYVVLRSIMLALYGRAWRAVPEARPLIRFYGSAYGLSVLIWLASLAVDTPERYVMWGVGLAVDLSLPPLSTRLHRRVPTSGRHAVERWALFTMIVLGESVVVVALGTAGSEWDLNSASAAVLGAVTVAAIWWLYFDRQANVVLRGGTPTVVIYSYAHLPLLMGLAATSAGLALLISGAGHEHLGPGPSAAYLGGVVVFLVSLVVTRTVTAAGPRRLEVSLKLGSAAAIVGLLALQSLIPPVALAAVLAAVLVSLVVADHFLIAPAEPAQG